MAIMLVVGIIFLIYPGGTLITATRILGIALLLMGAVGIVLPLLRKEDMSTPDVIVSAVEAIAGIIVLASPSFVISLYPVIVGIIIALYGLSDVMTALHMKQVDIGSWKTALILAVITVVLGVVVLVNPFKTMSVLVRIVGIVLIYKGITGLFIQLKA